jgi:tRNA A37 threonylcarbamoyladenosine biosynthesis protein TsaE
VWSVGWRELGTDHEIVIVEWPERAEALLPSDRWDILIEHASPDTRRVTVTAQGAAAQRTLAET